MTAGKRPTSITVISWIIIALSALGLVLTVLADIVPEARQRLEGAGIPGRVALAWGLLENTLPLAAGIAIRNGRNWGRILFLCVVPVSIAIAFFAYAFLVLWSVLIYLLFPVFLVRRSASAYFRRESLPGSAGA